MKERSRLFLDKLTEAGGTYRILWSAKRNPSDRYENIFYVALYGKPREAGGSHPLLVGAIINEFDGGEYEILFPSPHNKIEDDVNHVLSLGNDKG